MPAKHEHQNRNLRLESLENRRMLAGDMAATAMDHGSESLMGDADQNGRVDFVDFLRCAKNFGSNNATWGDGDFDGDGGVSFRDFTALSHNFGKSRYAEPLSNASDGSGDAVGNQDRVLFRTRLSGIGSVHGEAEYEREHNGSEREFEVEIESGAPATTYSVAIDTIVVAQVATDAAGNGRIKLSTHPKVDESQMPADFPSVTETSTITVGDVLSGQFNGNTADIKDSNRGETPVVDRDESSTDDSSDDSSDDDSFSIDDDSSDDSSNDDGDADDNSKGNHANGTSDDSHDRSHELDEHDHDRQEEIELQTKLTGAGSARGEAEFESEHGGAKQEFELKLEGAQPNTTYAIAVDSIFAGNITTDSRGRGELELSTDPEDDELPLPASFPTIGVGTTLTVDELLSGVFALDD